MTEHGGTRAAVIRRWGSGMIARLWNKHRQISRPVLRREVERLAARLWGETHRCDRRGHRLHGHGAGRTGRPISLSDGEWETLKRRAEDAGLTAAEFVRITLGLHPAAPGDCPNPQCEQPEAVAALRDDEEPPAGTTASASASAAANDPATGGDWEAALRTLRETNGGQPGGEDQPAVATEADGWAQAQAGMAALREAERAEAEAVETRLRQLAE